VSRHACTEIRSKGLITLRAQYAHRIRGTLRESDPFDTFHRSLPRQFRHRLPHADRASQTRPGDWGSSWIGTTAFTWVQLSPTQRMAGLRGSSSYSHQSASQVVESDVARMVVFVHGDQLASLRRIVDRCVVDNRLRSRLLELMAHSAAQLETTTWPG
jgi:hypothetical protein